MYTIETIKKTKVYLANVEKVREIWPDHVEDFAYELMVAANSFEGTAFRFSKKEPSIIGAFLWSETPQGGSPWWSLHQIVTEA